MRFTVTYEDGTTDTVEPGPADVVSFETEHKTTLGKAIGTGSPFWTYYLSHHKLSRRGEGRTFEAWLDDVVSIKSSDAPDPSTADAPGPEESAPAD